MWQQPPKPICLLRQLLRALLGALGWRPVGRALTAEPTVVRVVVGAPVSVMPCSGSVRVPFERSAPLWDDGFCFVEDGRLRVVRVHGL